jgi:hypothetical protein
MLQIRGEQVRTFTCVMIDRANETLAGYARRRFPTVFAGRPDAELRDLARGVRATANRYGVTREDNVATFLDFTVMYGPDWPAAAWAADVLTCQALHGPDKVALLRHRVERTGVTL